MSETYKPASKSSEFGRRRHSCFRCELNDGILTISNVKGQKDRLVYSQMTSGSSAKNTSSIFAAN